MRQLDKDYFRKKLISLKKELVEEENTSGESVKAVELDQSKVGRLSRMDAMQMQSMAVESRRRREIKLKRVEAALIRMDKDEFGFCNNCGNYIKPERLEFDPSILLCIECAQSNGT